MSEQQNQAATTTATTANRNEPDTSEPTPERQAELRAAYEANVAAGRSPYDGVPIGTLGELRWILCERDWSVNIGLSPDKQRPDFRNADLFGANFGTSGVDVAKLRGADRSFANLGGAYLSGADLSGANLHFANLTGTSLTSAHLRGANLTEVRMDRETALRDARLDSQTSLGDIDWQGVPLTRVPLWPARLGDEQDITKAKTRTERVARYRDAARADRNLSIALRGQGLLIPASHYRLREQVLEPKARLLEFSLLGWVFSWLLNLVAGYGERPVRSLFTYLLVLFGFAGAYFAATNGLLGFGTGATQVQPLQWYEALVLSVNSFHGRGFFQPVQSLGDPVAILAAVEAVIGLFIAITFIEITVIATFTQRFFGGR
jgi:hypothetical protein